MADGPTAIAEAQKRALEIAAKITASGGVTNGGGDEASRKRPLEDTTDGGPITKKQPSDEPEYSHTPGMPNPKLIAQAAISRIAGQLGLAQSMTIEIKVPNRMVGLVIGRQGEMINRLQADSGAKIQVAPDGSEINGERNVQISGSPDTVEKAKVLVNQVIEEAGGVTSVVLNLEPGQEVVELMIPAGKVGLIIGKGGEMIKMLQERAGCKMQMIQDGPFANTPEKPLRMTGFAENCKKARQLVLELLEQKELEARGLTGDLSKGLPDTVEMHLQRELVGFVIGRNGENINNIQNTCNVRLQFQHDIPGTPFRLATISGDPQNCQRAKRMVEELVSERQQSGVKPRLDLPDPQGPQVQTVPYAIPANKCGLIIGKGGDTIRQLMVQTQCFIELDRGPNPNPHEKIFNIRGQPHQITAAQQMIMQKLDGGGIPGDGYSAMNMGYGGAPMGGGPPAGGSPWGPYGGGYGGGGAGGYPGFAGNPGGPQQGGPPQQQSAEAAWAAYYQQLQAYTQHQQQQQGGGGGEGGPPNQQRPPTQGQAPSGGAPPQSGDIQAQWAEYYRQLNNYYYGQQQQHGGGPPGGGPNPQQQGPPPQQQGGPRPPPPS